MQQFFHQLYRIIQIILLYQIYQTSYSKIHLRQQTISIHSMIEFCNFTVVINDIVIPKHQTAKLLFITKKEQIKNQEQINQANNFKSIHLKFTQKNIAQSHQRIRLQFNQNQQLDFIIQKHVDHVANIKGIKQQHEILAKGTFKFSTNQRQNYSSWELQNSSNEKIGYITANFDIFDKNGKLTNQKISNSELLLFSIKMNLLPINNKKRFFILFRLSENQERMSIKGLQKDWITYHEVLTFFAESKRQLASIEVQVYSFDSKFNEKQLQASCKTSILTNFQKSSQIKYQELELLNSDNIKIGRIEFRYCLNNKKNQKTVSIMNSRKYIENSISPSKLMASISPVPQSLSNQLLSSSMTSVKSINSFLIPHHKSKASNSHLTRRKNYSVLASNHGVSIGLKERFDSPKVLTNSYCYYGHKTLDATQLPTRQIYKFASFGFSQKPCLKSSNERKKNGPGPGGYRLPSIFDRYG